MKTYKNNEDLDIHFNSIVVDGHNDTMLSVIDEETWLPTMDIGEETKNHIDIPKLKAGGLNVPFFAAFTEGYYANTPKSLSRTLALINALYWTERENQEGFKITSSIEDIKKTVNEDKIAAFPTIEGAYSLDKDNAIELLRQYYDLGIRVIGFNWNYSNDLGEGCSKIYSDKDETKSTGGLTKLGQEVILEMNRLGILVDVSHMDEKTFNGVIEASRMPIIASHSGAYGIRNHPRNLKDYQLKALAKNHGVVGIVFCPSFLTDKNNAYLKDYINHIDYVVDLIGIDHVGIGSDFDGASLPEDIEDSSELYKVTEELIKRAYTKEDIEKILGKNMLRVIKEAEEASKANLENSKLDIKIIPNYNMGEIMESSTPVLKAKINNIEDYNEDNMEFRIIIDGIPYISTYNREDSILSYEIKEPLKEKYHLATFEILYNEEKLVRETRIFYNKF